MTPPKRILIASNGHKGMLRPSEACAAIADGLIGMDAVLTSVPMADGGDGLIEALTTSLQSEVLSIPVRDSLFRLREARLALLKTVDGPTAVIEAADTAGSAILALHERQTMVATTYGVGELILHAVERGYKRVIIGLGGGITTDCGMGLAQALGVTFLDRDGKVLQPICNQGFNAFSMIEVHDIKLDQLKIDLNKVEILVAADVDIPLLGARGQAITFGPQKGANNSEIAYFERGFTNMTDVIRRCLKRDIDIPMAGAAGGMAAGLYGIFGAKLLLGAELVAQELGLADKIMASDLLIVGEGKMDRSTFHRKAPHYLAEMAAACNVPVIAIVGILEHQSELFHSVYADIPLLNEELMESQLAMTRLKNAVLKLKTNLIKDL